MRDLTPRLAAWRDRGRTVATRWGEVFAVETGPSDAPAILVLHGFPTSCHDFVGALPILAERYRVVLHDQLGFGLSAKPRRYSYSLLDQARVAIAVWQEMGVERGHLVAHDYGTSVATELVALRESGELPLVLESVTLSNGSVLLELAKLTLTQRVLRNRLAGPLLARLASRRFFKRRLRRTLAPESSVEEIELDLMWEGIVYRHGRHRLPRISIYLEERVRYRERWVGALGRFDRPLHLLWGQEDPIAVRAVAERLAQIAPRARLTWLEEVGHYPMIEAPGRWAEAVLGFVEDCREPDQGRSMEPPSVRREKRLS